MNEQETLKLGKKLYENITNNANNIIPTKNYVEFVGVAIEALEEIQAYRAIGTVRQVQDFIADWRKYRELGTLKEFKDLKEKQIPKKLINVRKIKKFDGYDMGECPVCGKPLDNSFYDDLKFCFGCGQKIDWSDEQ